MEKGQSLLLNIKDNASISLKKYVTLNRGNYDILIVPETGSWTIIPESDRTTLANIAAIQNIVDLRNELLSREKLFDELFYSGFLAINGKDVSMIQGPHQQNQQKCDSLSLVVLKYTNACNLRCAYCYSYDIHTNKKVEIPNEYIYKLSELIGNTDASHKINICFHGGEPLTRFNDIVECVKNLKSRRNGNVDFTIQTNGTLLTPKIAKYLKEEDFSVGISVDGFDELTNRLRPFANNRPSVNSTLKAIKICSEVGITPGIISVMTQNNYMKVTETMAFLAEMGIKAFHFNHFLPTGRGGNKEKVFSVNIEELLKTRKQILLFINDYNASIECNKRISERFTRNLLISLTSQQPLPYMCAQSPCGAGRRQLALTYDGSIYPCDDLCNEPQFKIGNVNDIDNLNQTLVNSCAVKMCQLHCIDNILECKKCIYRKICISHCCSDSYFYTGKLNSPHSLCALVKQFIPTIIDLLYEGRIKLENILF